MPTLDANISSRRNYVRFARLLLQQQLHPRVLVVGGQILGQGMERISRHPAIEFVSLDVSLGARTTLVADSHDIPFAPGTFDGVIIQAVLHYLAWSGRLDKGLKVRTLAMPDVFFEHAKPEEQIKNAGLSAFHIAAAAVGALGQTLDPALAQGSLRG